MWEARVIRRRRPVELIIDEGNDVGRGRLEFVEVLVHASFEVGVEEDSGDPND